MHAVEVRGILVAAIATLLLAACDLGSVVEVVPAAEVQVTPGADAVLPGESVQYTATVRSAQGETLTRTVQWSSSDTRVASVSPTGLATTLAPGLATITAAVEGATGTALLDVQDACEVGVGQIAAGDTRSGSLTANDCDYFEDGGSLDFWILQVTSRTTIQFDLTSGQFDPLLAVAGGTQDLVGSTIEVDDDGGEDLNSRICGTFQPGTYVIVATSYSAGESGAYQLSATGTSSCAPQRMLIGTSVAGRLSAIDPQLSDGSHYDVWEFTVSSTGQVQIDLTSDEFDSYLLLRNAAGPVAEDDDGGEGTNSRLVLTLTPGTYTVIANSFGAGEQGEYHLSVSGSGSQQTAQERVLPGTVKTAQPQLDAAPIRLDGEAPRGYRPEADKVGGKRAGQWR